MVLGAILSLCLLHGTSAGLADFVTLRQQSVPASSPSGSEQSPTPEPSPSQNSAPAPQQAPPAKRQPSKPKPAAKRPTHRKRAASGANCSTSPAPSGNGNDAQGTQPANSATASANCPPPKIVVSHGSTAEPGVHLTGNPSKAQATYDLSSTEQLLAATDENLKKVSGQPLPPDRQEMVNQINQFIKQSQAAVTAGDTGRGHTLARKALLLSEELVKP